jgi:hypothetical protein
VIKREVCFVGVRVLGQMWLGKVASERFGGFGQRHLWLCITATRHSDIHAGNLPRLVLHKNPSEWCALRIAATSLDAHSIAPAAGRVHCRHQRKEVLWLMAS